MADLKAIYVIVSGASSARNTPELLEALAQFKLPIYTILTENAYRVISPYNLADHQGHTLINSYFSPMLIDNRDPSLTLVAPATFNTLNKISQGIADTLAHSLVAEAIGAGWPVIVAPSMNPHLGNHPQVATSLKTLRRWGVTLLEPSPAEGLLVMASLEEIVTAIRRKLKG
jgi:phosphopantothenoylcysteine synthetase/decarboxylase